MYYSNYIQILQIWSIGYACFELVNYLLQQKHFTQIGNKIRKNVASLLQTTKSKHADAKC